MKKKWKCSHKALEWRNYKLTKEPGDGQFPPTEYCGECALSKKMKPTKVKAVKAYAVLNENGFGIEEYAWNLNGDGQYAIFPTKKEAFHWCVDNKLITEVLITPITKKKK